MRVDRRKWKRALAALALALGALLVWGVLIEPRFFEERREVAIVPGLPERWEGATVAVLADLQLGMYLNNVDTVRRMIATLVERRPDAVLLAGDFLYHPTEPEEDPEDIREEREIAETRAEALGEIRSVVGLLEPLAAAGIPTYAVLGNHDYAMENRNSAKLPEVAGAMAEALRGAGFTVLRNAAVPLRRAGEEPPSLFLVGLDSHYAGEDDVERAFAGLPAGASRLVLMHNPQTFAEIPAGEAPFAVAAHTHGGQVRIPFLPRWSWLDIVQKGEVPADGWIRDFGEAGNRLYVNRGVGFSVLPVRINCRPELTLFTLRRGPVS